MPCRSLVAALIAVMLLGGAYPGLAMAGSFPTPPAQPTDGPGGSDVAYPGVQTEQREAGVTGYWLIVPTDANGTPVLDAHLPLVIFLHGFSAIDPVSYGAWLDHIAQRGAIVVYPIYQSDDQFIAGTDRYLPNARMAIRSAIDELGDASPDALDPDRVAVAGHSAGGLLATQYALTASEEGLPVPTVLMTLMPGGCGECGSLAAVLRMPSDLSGDLDPDTLAILFNAASDDVVGEGASQRIWRSLEQLPEDQRDHVTLTSDDHGSPALVSEHNTPQTDGTGQPDDFDYGAIWKLFDGLMSCAFDDSDCSYALGGGDDQTSLGDWSDGVPVTPLTVTDTF